MVVVQFVAINGELSLMNRDSSGQHIDIHSYTPGGTARLRACFHSHQCGTALRVRSRFRQIFYEALSDKGRSI